MLVLDPTKRLALRQIRLHRWMVQEVPPQKPQLNRPSLGVYNEQVLRLMHSLGIDQHKTVEVRLILVNVTVYEADMKLMLDCFSSQSLQNKSYNHFAAIYYLLVERLKAHRSSFPVEQRLNGAQRRPSSVAEQTVLKVASGVLRMFYISQ